MPFSLFNLLVSLVPLTLALAMEGRQGSIATIAYINPFCFPISSFYFIPIISN